MQRDPRLDRVFLNKHVLKSLQPATIIGSNRKAVIETFWHDNTAQLRARLALVNHAAGRTDSQGLWPVV